MRKILTFLLVLFAGGIAAFAQQSVKGQVVDQNGLPIIGMTVLEKGTGNGVTTDVDGNYEIRVGGGQRSN